MIQTGVTGAGELTEPLGGLGNVHWSTLEQTRSLPQRVADELAEAIIQGRLPGGSRLSEPEIARAFGISRTPVREALLALERDDLLERPRRKGARVAIVTAKQVFDTYVCRAYLFGFSAWMCAGRAEETLLDELASLLKTMDVAVGSTDIPAYYQLNCAFHDKIGSATDNAMLLRLMNGMGRRTMRLRFMSLTVPGRLHASMKMHHQIYEDLARQDGSAAQAHVRELVSAAGDAILDHFFEDSSKPVSAFVETW